MANDGNDLRHDFETWAQAFTERVSPASRRKVMRALAQQLRKRQQQRIAEQKNPDGSAWEPRKRLRARRGRIKRRAAMYMKLRTARHLKIVATDDSALLKFAGRDAWIARVAQYGLIDKVRPNGPSVRYPVRQLLGFSDADREWLQGFLIDNLIPGD